VHLILQNSVVSRAVFTKIQLTMDHGLRTLLGDRRRKKAPVRGSIEERKKALRE